MSDPAVQQSGPRPRSLGLLIGYWALFVVTLLVSLGARKAAPSFVDLFGSFGANIPWATAMLLRAPGVLMVIPFVVLPFAVAFSSQRTMGAAAHRRFKLRLTVLAAGATLLLGAAYWVLYLPIFRLGQVL